MVEDGNKALENTEEEEIREGEWLRGKEDGR